MPQIIYRKSAASPWIKQGDRLTKTFSSGLCLIQQTYIAPKSLATYDAFEEGDAITESQPCIDGAYIFPAPDYQDTGDGFMRCTVTAYGRWRTGQHISRQKRAMTLNITGSVNGILDPFSDGSENNEGGSSTVSYTMTDSIDVLADDITVVFVAAKGSNLSLLPPSSQITIHTLTGALITNQLSITHLQALLGRGITARYYKPAMGGDGQTSIVIFDIDPDFWSGDFAAKNHGISLNLTRCESVDYGQFLEYTASFQAAAESLTSTPFAFTKS
jgi:hypothetical protein